MIYIYILYYIIIYIYIYIAQDETLLRKAHEGRGTGGYKGGNEAMED